MREVRPVSGPVAAPPAGPGRRQASRPPGLAAAGRLDRARPGRPDRGVLHLVAGLLEQAELAEYLVHRDRGPAARAGRDVRHHRGRDRPVGRRGPGPVRHGWRPGHGGPDERRDRHGAHRRRGVRHRAGRRPGVRAAERRADRPLPYPGLRRHARHPGDRDRPGQPDLQRPGDLRHPGVGGGVRQQEPAGLDPGAGADRRRALRRHRPRAGQDQVRGIHLRHRRQPGGRHPGRRFRGSATS